MFKRITSAAFLAILMLVAVLSGCNYNIVDTKELTQKATEACERAYFEGQRDALDGDVRIKLNKDSCYQWVKSPWNNGQKPIYNPTYLDTRNGN